MKIISFHALGRSICWIYLNPQEHILIFLYYQQNKAGPSWTEVAKIIMRGVVRYLPKQERALCQLQVSQYEQPSDQSGGNNSITWIEIDGLHMIILTSEEGVDDSRCLLQA